MVGAPGVATPEGAGMIEGMIGEASEGMPARPVMAATPAADDEPLPEPVLALFTFLAWWCTLSLVCFGFLEVEWDPLARARATALRYSAALDALVVVRVDLWVLWAFVVEDPWWRDLPLCSSAAR